MRAEIYWIAGVPRGRLAVLPRPRGGDWLEDEVTSLRLAGVDALVCLLTQEEMEELNLLEEARCCSAGGIEFVSFPITDRGVPASKQATLSTVQRLAALLTEGKSVAIHCRQGVGRSALMAACLLASFGQTSAAAFERIARARGCPVPDTPEQQEWVKQFVDRYSSDPAGWLDRKGGWPMEVKPLEVYSEASNYAIVRMPGRNYPGCVIQGDSLALLCQTVRRVLEAVRAKGIEDEEILGDLEDLYHSLLGRLLDYQEVIRQEGFELPYSRPVSQEDFVRRMPRKVADDEALP